MAETDARANREDELLAKAIEFLRQTHARKAGGLFGTVKVVLTFDAGKVALAELEDKTTIKPHRRPG